MRKKVTALVMAASICLPMVTQGMPVKAAEDEVLENVTGKEYDDAVMVGDGILAKQGNTFAVMESSDAYSFIEQDGTETMLTEAVKSYGIDAFYAQLSGCFLEEGVVYVGKGDKFSFLDKDGKVWGDFAYDKVHYINENLVWAYNEGSTWNIYTTSGELVHTGIAEYKNEYSDTVFTYPLEESTDDDNPNSTSNIPQKYHSTRWRFDRFDYVGDSVIFSEGDSLYFYNQDGKLLNEVKMSSYSIDPNSLYVKVNTLKEGTDSYSTAIYTDKGQLLFDTGKKGYFDLKGLDVYGVTKFNTYDDEQGHMLIYDKQGNVLMDATTIDGYDDKAAVVADSDQGDITGYRLKNYNGEVLIDIESEFKKILGKYEYVTSSTYYANDKLVLSVQGDDPAVDNDYWNPDNVFTQVYDMKGNVLASFNGSTSDMNEEYILIKGDGDTRKDTIYDYNGQKISESINGWLSLDSEYEGVVGYQREPLDESYENWGSNIIFENKKIVKNIVKSYSNFYPDGTMYINGKAQAELSSNERMLIDSNGNTIIPGGYEYYILSDETPYIIACNGDKSDVYDEKGVKINDSGIYDNVNHVAQFSLHKDALTKKATYENYVNKYGMLIAENQNDKVEILKIEDALELGDVDGNKTILMNDAMLIAQHFSGNKTLTEDQLKRADIDRDGKIMMNDTMLLAHSFIGDESIE